MIIHKIFKKKLKEIEFLKKITFEIMEEYVETTFKKSDLLKDCNIKKKKKS